MDTGLIANVKTIPAAVPSLRQYRQLCRGQDNTVTSAEVIYLNMGRSAEDKTIPPSGPRLFTLIPAAVPKISQYRQQCRGALHAFHPHCKVTDNTDRSSQVMALWAAGTRLMTTRRLGNTAMMKKWIEGWIKQLDDGN